MAMSIVDFFEIINVEHDHAKRLLVTFVSFNFFFWANIQIATFTYFGESNFPVHLHKLLLEVNCSCSFVNGDKNVFNEAIFT